MSFCCHAGLRQLRSQDLGGDISMKLSRDGPRSKSHLLFDGASRCQDVCESLPPLFLRCGYGFGIVWCQHFHATINQTDSEVDVDADLSTL